MIFEKYYSEVLKDNIKKNNNFLGISKKENPKWEGWKIIESFKERGVPIVEINDSYIMLLVENYHRIKHIKEYL